MRVHPGAMILSVALAAIGLAGCGDDDSPAELGSYCDRAQAYADATSDINTATVQSVLESFTSAASAARAVADEAPGAVRTPHDHIADAAEALVAGLTERHPQTMEEFGAANDAVIAELDRDYGDLDDDVSEVEEFVTRECGFDLD